MSIRVGRHLVEPDSDPLLSTGDVAALLGCSRQHVVDLCDEGSLESVTVGTHRRVRRSEVERLQNGVPRLTREQVRSLWLAHAVAGEFVRNPERVRQKALSNIQRMHSKASGRARAWIEEWERLLVRDAEGLLRVLVATSAEACEMRQNSPFAGVLSESQRASVLASWRNSTSARSN